MQIVKYNSFNDKATEQIITGSETIIQGEGGGGESLWRDGGGQHALVPKESKNEASGIDSVAIGTQTITKNQGELSTGVYNQSYLGYTMFSIGDGTMETTYFGPNGEPVDEIPEGAEEEYTTSYTIHRHNMFEVSYGGNTYQSGDVNAYNAYFDGGVTSYHTIESMEKLQAPYAYIDDIDSKHIVTENLEVTIQALINELLAKDITTETLTVTKAAHFFELIIDQIKASKGQIIITPANAVIDLVEEVPQAYRCYFRATDGNRQIYNSFEVDDQIICQTFNAAQGTQYDVSNKYYWMRCIGYPPTTEKKIIDGQVVDCWWIDLSIEDKDPASNGIPEAGDEIVMLGNRTISSRQSALILSAYNNTYLDPTIKSPSLVQYKGINDYDLSTHRYNVISRGLNSFKGKFIFESGEDVEDAIDEHR